MKNHSSSEVSSLYHLVYISRANKLFSSEELVQLLQRARQRNQEHNLTGLLLYKDASFMQLIEGPELEVHKVFASIERDSRHSRIRTLISEAIPSRMFNDWHMGFYNIDEIETSELEGFSRYLQNANSLEKLINSPSNALKALNYFRARS